ncbi:unnamed protein product [Caenorhabditis brenneri]
MSTSPLRTGVFVPRVDFPVMLIRVRRVEIVRSRESKGYVAVGNRWRDEYNTLLNIVEPEVEEESKNVSPPFEIVEQPYPSLNLGKKKKRCELSFTHYCF